MNGDEVRGARFASTPVEGYEASETDDLLQRIAAELDAGRPAGPLIENAKLQVTSKSAAIPLTLGGAGPSRYDIDAVDWFLGKLRLDEDHPELAETGADPWRDLAVAQVAPDVGGTPDKPSLVQLFELDKLLELDPAFTKDCTTAWKDFGRQSGVFLREGRAKGGRLWAPRHELRTAEQKAIASYDTSWTKGATIRRAGRASGSFTLLPSRIRVGGRSFTYRSTSSPPPPGVAELLASRARDVPGQFAANAGGLARPAVGPYYAEGSKTIGDEIAEQLGWRLPGQIVVPVAQETLAGRVRELVDETGTPILYTSGKNYARRACACIIFPDQRWLRFLVRGTRPENAIMTAVDQAGHKVARYRELAEDLDPYRVWGEVVITVHPDQELADELVLAIAISAGWLDSYFNFPEAGAGAVDAGAGTI